MGKYMKWYPHLVDVVHPEVANAIRIAYDNIYQLADAVGKANENLGTRITDLGVLYGPGAIREALEAGGAAPLNVSNLPGKLAEPQIGGAHMGTALPYPPDPTAQDGALAVLRPSQTLWYYDETTSPGVWRSIAAVGVTAQGLRAAKPAAGNTGYTYFEIDTGWLYIDTGAAYIFVAGLDYGTNATRAAIAGIGANDNGALFLTSDTSVIWRVIGGAWTTYRGLPASDGTLYKHGRATTGAIGAGASAAVTLNWTTAFADANYTVSAEVVEATASTSTLRVHHVESVAAASVTVRVVNDDGGAPHTGILHVIAVHDP